MISWTFPTLLLAQIVSFIVCAVIPSKLIELPKPSEHQPLQISAKGDEVWVLDTNGGIYRWHSDSSKWETIPNIGAFRIAAAADAFTWAIDTTGQISRWNPTERQWEHLPNKKGIMQISAVSKDQAVGVSLPGFKAYSWNGHDWIHIGDDMAWAVLGENGERWALKRVQTDEPLLIFPAQRFEKGEWIGKSSGINFMTIDVQNSEQIVGQDFSGRLYRYVNSINKWQEILPEGISCYSASIGKNKIYALTFPDNNTSVHNIQILNL